MRIKTLVGWHLDNFLFYRAYDRSMFEHLSRQIDEEQDLQDRRNFDGHVTSSFCFAESREYALVDDPSLGF